MESTHEGIIRYDMSGHRETPPVPEGEYRSLERVRRPLFALRLIGVTSDGLGYGNVSVRRSYPRFLVTSSPQFLITGSQTGHLPILDGRHYVRVLEVVFDRFAVISAGPISPSSEAVTHAALYQGSPQIGAVIHLHHPPLWRELLGAGYPATSSRAANGTPEMAEEIEACVSKSPQGLVVMAGHPDGVLAYGPSPMAALSQIARVWSRYVGSDFKR